MSKNISIIGPAKGDKFSKELYTKMVMKAYGIILGIQGIKPEDVNLVSGGSAWSDHVAVSLFTSEIFKSCKLYLPCPLVKLNGKYQFKDTGEYSWKTNSGRVLNFYHTKFKLVSGIDSINEIGIFEEKYSNFWIDDSHFGFHKRNEEVAKSDYLIAFSFDDGPYPQEGGTYFTWSKFTGPEENRFCIPISSL